MRKESINEQLSVAVDTFFGQPSISNRYAPALHNLFRILKLGDDNASLRGALTPSQTQAMRLLAEWWTGRDADHELKHIKALVLALALQESRGT